MSSPRIFAIIPAAGSGLRMGQLTASRPKVLLPIKKNDPSTVLEHTLAALLAAKVVRGIVVAARESDVKDILRLRENFEPLRSGEVVFEVVVGGERRQDSVRIALAKVPAEEDLVIVHDGARPLCSAKLFRAVAEAAAKSGGAIAALPVKPTIKESVDGKAVARTIPRETLWETQTPQAFSAKLLREAHARAEQEKFSATDDSQLLERLGESITIVMGEEQNIKITTPFDLKLAESLSANSESSL